MSPDQAGSAYLWIPPKKVIFDHLKPTKASIRQQEAIHQPKVDELPKQLMLFTGNFVTQPLLIGIGRHCFSQIR